MAIQTTSASSGDSVTYGTAESDEPLLDPQKSYKLTLTEV
jgi:hypothetical protein